MDFYKTNITRNPNPFIIRIKTDNLGAGSSSSSQFRMNNAVGAYKIIAKNISSGNIQTFGNLTGDQTITFSEGAGTYELQIIPRRTNPFRRIQFTSLSDRLKILGIYNWGSIKWTSFASSFINCSNLDVLASDVPDLSQCVSIDRMFNGCVSLDGTSANWNWKTNHLTDFTLMFSACANFNGDISNWNTSSLVEMRDMLNGCLAFNRDLNTKEVTINDETYIAWNTSNVVNMQAVFGNCNYDGDITNWNTSKVTNMSLMFYFNDLFNRDISTKEVTVGSLTYIAWNTEKVLNFQSMFHFRNNVALGIFNQNIGNWNISKVTNFTGFMTGKAPANYSATNLDSIYINWSILSVFPNITITFGTIKYNSSTQPEKDILLGAPNNWIIADGGTV